MDNILFWSAQVLTFAAVVFLSLLGVRWAEGQMAVRRRLAETAHPEQHITGAVVKDKEVSNSFLSWVQTATLNDPKEAGKLRRDLAEAGFESPTAPIFYVIFRFTLAIGLPLIFLVSQQFVAKPMVGLGMIFTPLILCLVGMIAPSALLNNRVEARRTQLEQEFPDALDLLVVCIEAGLGLEAGFVRVAQELKGSHPRISDALERVTDQLRAGRARPEALRSMSDRTNVDTVKSFAALLIQTDTLGTSIAQTLRTFSNEMRERRMLKAEEKAMRIPVLMTIPLVSCMLPVIITALLLPAILDVGQQIIPMMTGRR